MIVEGCVDYNAQVVPGISYFEQTVLIQMFLIRSVLDYLIGNANFGTPCIKAN